MGLFGFIGDVVKGFVPGGDLIVGAVEAVTRRGGNAPAVIPSRLPARSRGTAISTGGFWSDAQLAEARAHLGHAHSGGTPGHAWLSAEMATAARSSGLLPTPRSGCLIPGQRIDPVTGECKFFLGDEVGRDRGIVEGGGVVMGRFGPAMIPDVSARGFRCLAGMVLGRDDLCYNSHGDNKISNRNRKWPRGRAPLLTGGEMNCITTASRVTGKIATKVKQLQDMGMMGKAKPRTRRKKKQPVAALGPGVTVIDTS